MTKNELRYQGTELQLMDAFEQAIVERPVERITVTALAAAAGISKAAFYRHYRDVRDLAETFAADYALSQVSEMTYLSEYLSDPHAFAREFTAHLAQDGVGVALVENGLGRTYLDELTATVLDALDSQGLLPVPEDADGAGAVDSSGSASQMEAYFLFQGLAALAVRYRDDLEALAQVAGNLVAGARARRGC